MWNENAQFPKPEGPLRCLSELWVAGRLGHSITICARNCGWDSSWVVSDVLVVLKKPAAFDAISGGRAGRGSRSYQFQGNDELLRRGTRSTHARIERRESWRIAIRNPCHSLDGVRAARGRPSNRCLVHHPGSTWTCCNRNVKRSRNQQPM